MLRDGQMDMAQYYVQPIDDKQGRDGAWEVAKKHGQGTTRIADHRKKQAAIRNAKRTANSGDSIAVKRMKPKHKKGQIQRWIDV